MERDRGVPCAAFVRGGRGDRCALFAGTGVFPRDRPDACWGGPGRPGGRARRQADCAGGRSGRSSRVPRGIRRTAGNTGDRASFPAAGPGGASGTSRLARGCSPDPPSRHGDGGGPASGGGDETGRNAPSSSSRRSRGSGDVRSRRCGRSGRSGPVRAKRRPVRFFRIGIRFPRIEPGRVRCGGRAGGIRRNGGASRGKGRRGWRSGGLRPDPGGHPARNRVSGGGPQDGVGGNGRGGVPAACGRFGPKRAYRGKFRLPRPGPRGRRGGAQRLPVPPSAVRSRDRHPRGLPAETRSLTGRSDHAPQRTRGGAPGVSITRRRKGRRPDMPENRMS